MKTYSRKKGSDCSDVIVNLDELCRLCLRKPDELVPIFNDEEPVPLPLRIMACVALEVVEDDGLPNMICNPCRYQLDQTYNFRKKCESSDLKLRRHLKLLRKSGKYSDLTEEDEEDIGEELIEETEDAGTQKRNSTTRPQNVKEYLEDLIVEENSDEEGGYMEVLDEHVDEREFLGGTITYIQRSDEVIEEEDPESITLSMDAEQSNKEACTLRRVMKQEIVENEEDNVVDESSLFLLSEDNTEMLEEEQDQDIEQQQHNSEMESIKEAVKAKLAEEHGFNMKGDLQIKLDETNTNGNVTQVRVTTDDGSVVLIELMPEEEIPQLMQEDDEGELKVFQCPHCPKAFARRIQLNRHSSVHMEQRGFSCNICEKWFPTRSALIRHERIHTGEKPFECGVCKRCFAQKEILYRHLMTHTGQKPYPCNQCDKSFTQKEALKSHQRLHSKTSNVEIQLHRCTLCPKVFCHASGLSRHLVTHTGKTFKCRDCDKSFSDKSSLRRHHKMTNHQS